MSSVAAVVRAALAAVISVLAVALWTSSTAATESADVDRCWPVYGYDLFLDAEPAHTTYDHGPPLTVVAMHPESADGPKSSGASTCPIVRTAASGHTYDALSEPAHTDTTIASSPTSLPWSGVAANAGPGAWGTAAESPVGPQPDQAGSLHPVQHQRYKVWPLLPPGLLMHTLREELLSLITEDDYALAELEIQAPARRIDLHAAIDAMVADGLAEWVIRDAAGQVTPVSSLEVPYPDLARDEVWSVPENDQPSLLLRVTKSGWRAYFGRSPDSGDRRW